MKWKPEHIQAIETMVENPLYTQKEIAHQVGVHPTTLGKWLKDPMFVEAFYDKYMIAYGSKLPSVLEAMIREAQAGNVQAGRLVLEHSGKLVKNVTVKHESPFEKFLSTEQVEIDADYEEIPNEPAYKKIREKQALEHMIDKNSPSYLEKRRKAYKIRARAKKVGLKPLKRGRYTLTQRTEYLKELERLEREQRESLNFSPNSH